MDRGIIGIWLLGVLTSFTFCAVQAEGRERGFRILDVEDISMEASKFDCNREPMTPDIPCTDYLYRMAFRVDLRLLEVGYFRNNVHTEALESQVKTVGWEYEIGLRVFPWLDIFRHHHSRHVMEGEQPRVWDIDRQALREVRYPVEDSYGIRLRFWTNDREPGYLFGGR